MGQSTLDLAIARITSLAVAVACLVVCAPLFGLIALAIKIESPGPLFFVQDRLGRRGRRFRLVKFRTTRVVRTHTGWVTDNYDRITSVGRVLRLFRLDELPQLVNVIRGDMDLSETGWKFGPL